LENSVHESLQKTFTGSLGDTYPVFKNSPVFKNVSTAILHTYAAKIVDETMQKNSGLTSML
jgi:hypothetical protein